MLDGGRCPGAEPELTAAAGDHALGGGVLYTTGLRLGELQRLTLGDIEDDGGVLRVRESKFHKSRLLPLSAGARAELRPTWFGEPAPVLTLGRRRPAVYTRPRPNEGRIRSAACSTG